MKLGNVSLNGRLKVILPLFRYATPTHNEYGPATEKFENVLYELLYDWVETCPCVDCVETRIPR